MARTLTFKTSGSDEVWDFNNIKRFSYSPNGASSVVAFLDNENNQMTISSITEEKGEDYFYKALKASSIIFDNNRIFNPDDLATLIGSSMALSEDSNLSHSRWLAILFSSGTREVYNIEFIDEVTQSTDRVTISFKGSISDIALIYSSEAEAVKAKKRVEKKIERLRKSKKGWSLTEKIV
jgi:hypothetical protein